MRMQNTDMEFVTFDAQDVIATSTPTPGSPTLTVSGYYDAPDTRNFKVTFGGTDYFNMGDLREAFDAAAGSPGAYKSAFSYKDNSGSTSSDNFGNAFSDDLNTHSAADVDRYSAGNGVYTYGIDRWLHSNLQ